MIIDVSLRKGLVLGIILLFTGTSFLPTICGRNQEMISINSEAIVKLHNPETESMLDVQYIYNLTENLSRIIFTEYNESAGEIAKGRAFGTKGENKAAEILLENMTKLGLYAWKEPIKNLPPELPDVATKLEVQAKGLTIYNKTSQNKTSIDDCYVSPRWNFTGLPIVSTMLLQDLQDKKPILGSIAAKLIPLLIPRPNGIFDRKYNFYSRERLTHNFSYTNLKVIRKPTTYSLTKDLTRRIRNDEPFVYIDKLRGFSLWPEQEINFNGLLYNSIISKLPKNEKILWALFQPNCKGIIVYDSNNDTYNTGDMGYDPLPIISINRTVGGKIFEKPENYNIDFYINQRWNESVESYNVIGQLNGTNPNETVIVCSLYDSWWCQGTGDSAIGMAMVLGIAKYFIDHNITPKCKVKFIAFGGEEGGNVFGRRGAKYYEANHSDENITTVIDVNQVGFTQTYPRLTLHIWINNESLNSTIRGIADGTNYIERTGNVTNFTVEYEEEGGQSNVYPFAVANLSSNRSCNTILFAKDFGWIRHHRDGENHDEGDVLKYFNWTDVKVTGEMVWNVTKYFTVDASQDIFTDYRYNH